ncbi:leucine--tRNA ligase, cytoplasmic-like [Pieris brassicae]|uniref:leucine--tRNA ligase, cytoplasmic-like n=1 Tax=Pieris brassicae TaxID=7116 RepID=UPI001E662330|nr:leucine--tRNA ligase, cytoplasmic-like [Pieris brassicae]
MLEKKAGDIDIVAMKASNYLMEAAHSFRIYLKNHCAVRKPKKGEAPKPERKPNKAVIWVAKEYPKWQHMILSTLKELNGPSGLPDNKVLSTKLSAINDLKKYMKTVMPFVQATRDNLQKIGPEALSVALPFDEAQLLEDNKQYLLNTLDLDAIEVKHTDSPDTPEKTIEDCAPGLTVTFTNPTPMSGLFTISVTLVDGDTVEKIKAKIAKEIKAIKDINALKLWQYLDPALGPRKIPVQGDHVTKCAELINGDGIRVHVEASRIELVQNGTNIDVGLQFVYTYDK